MKSMTAPCPNQSEGLITPARPKIIATDPDRASLEIQAQASRIGADLIVAGAYGHARLGEWMFGGATFDLLREPERFVLLSH